MKKNVSINHIDYTYAIDENGKKSLERYNPKYKMWVKLRFSEVSQGNSVTHTLSEQFVAAQLGLLKSW